MARLPGTICKSNHSRTGVVVLSSSSVESRCLTLDPSRTGSLHFCGYSRNIKLSSCLTIAGSSDRLYLRSCAKFACVCVRGASCLCKLIQPDQGLFYLVIIFSCRLSYIGLQSWQSTGSKWLN